MRKKVAQKNPLEKEILTIQDKSIRDFVHRCFQELTPAWFWTAPTSTSGRYHPSVVNGEGGLVRHIKYALWWAEELMRAWPGLDDMSRDIVRAAILLHDLYKNGKQATLKKKPKDIVKTHGPLLATTLRNIAGAPVAVYHIAALIEGHMGIWTQPQGMGCWCNRTSWPS